MLARIDRPVEFTALSGRRARRVVEFLVDVVFCIEVETAGKETSFPRLPITVGVPVMLLILWGCREVGAGKAVRVQKWLEEARQ